MVIRALKRGARSSLGVAQFKDASQERLRSNLALSVFGSSGVYVLAFVERFIHSPGKTRQTSARYWVCKPKESTHCSVSRCERIFSAQITLGDPLRER